MTSPTCALPPLPSIEQLVAWLPAWQLEGATGGRRLRRQAACESRAAAEQLLAETAGFLLRSPYACLSFKLDGSSLLVDGHEPAGGWTIAEIAAMIGLEAALAERGVAGPPVDHEAFGAWTRRYVSALMARQSEPAAGAATEREAATKGDPGRLATYLLGLPAGERWALVGGRPSLHTVEFAQALLTAARLLPGTTGPDAKALTAAGAQAESLLHLAAAVAARVKVGPRVPAIWVADLLAEVWALRGEYAAQAGRGEEGALACDLARAIAEAGSGDPRVAFQIANGEAWVRWMRGDWQGCLTVLDAGIAEAVAAGQLDDEAVGRWRRACVLQALGRDAEAHHEAATVLALEIDLGALRSAVETLYSETRGGGALH